MAFGDKLASAGNAAGSIPNPASPSASVTVAVGNLIFVSLGERTSVTGGNCTDNLGNSYTALTSADGGNGTVKAWYSICTVAGSCTPSVATTASNDDYGLSVAVFEGPFAASPLDKNPACTTGTTSTVATLPATGTLTQADNLVIGYYGSGNGVTYSSTSLAGGLAQQNASGTGSNTACTIIVFGVVASTSTITPTITVSATPASAQGVAVFKKSINPTGTGALSAQSAHVSGSGASSSTGTGTPAAQSVSVDGAGTSSSTGAGTLPAQTSDVTGAAVAAWVATGALSAQPVSVDGSGASSSTGTGAPTSQDSAIDGVAVAAWIAAGALSVGVSTLSGNGVVQWATAVALVASNSAVAGEGSVSGAPTVTGSGDLAANASVVVGVGLSISIGTGALLVNVPSLDGSGLSESIGSGDLTSTSTIDGQGISSSTGTGDLAAQSSRILGFETLPGISMSGFYADDGTVNVTIVDGTTAVKLQAADGSLNIIESDGNEGPLQHPCGAIRVTNANGDRVHHPDGSWYKNQVFGHGITIIAGAFA